MREEFLKHFELFGKNKILSCEEKSKKLYLHTKEASFYKIKIDGGVIQDSVNKKCDFIIIEKEKENIWIYVELKGNKLAQAYEQILKTFNQYKGNDTTINYAAIVLSSCPKVTPKIQNIKKKLKDQGFKNLFQKGQIIRLEYLNKKDLIKITN